MLVFPYVFGSGGGSRPRLYLPYSRPDKILAQADAMDYIDGESTWGPFNVSSPETTHITTGYDKALYPEGGWVDYELDSLNKDITIYAVMREVIPQSGDRTIFGVGYSLSTGNYPNWYVRGTTIRTSLYSYDRDTNLPYCLYHAFAIKVEKSTNTVKFFADGNAYSVETSGLGTVGTYVSFCGREIGNLTGNDYILFAGIVDEAELDEQILANTKFLINPTEPLEPLTRNLIYVPVFTSPILIDGKDVITDDDGVEWWTSQYDYWNFGGCQDKYYKAFRRVLNTANGYCWLPNAIGYGDSVVSNYWLDLGSSKPHRPDLIKIYYGWSDPNKQPIYTVLQGSNDGETYEDLMDLIFPYASPYTPIEFDCSSIEKEYKIYRIKFISCSTGYLHNANNYGITICDVQFIHKIPINI